MEAEERLLTPELTTGTFLVRKCESVSGHFVLSVRDGGAVKHYMINKLDSGVYFIFNQAPFSNLPELVQHYSRYSDGLACALNTPCPNDKPLLTHSLDKDDWEIPRECLDVTRKLDQGLFGEVWAGVWNNATLVAVKVLLAGAMSPSSFLEEANVMKNIRHNHLLQVNVIASKYHKMQAYICQHRLSFLFSMHYIASFQRIFNLYEKSCKSERKVAISWN